MTLRVSCEEAAGAAGDGRAVHPMLGALAGAPPELLSGLEAQAAGHTLLECRAWLAARGVATSVPALCVWVSRRAAAAQAADGGEQGGGGGGGGERSGVSAAGALGPRRGANGKWPAANGQWGKAAGDGRVAESGVPAPESGRVSQAGAGDALAAVGWRFFSVVAMLQADAKGWRWAQRGLAERERLALQREKYQRQTAEMVVKAAAEARVQAAEAGPGDNREKLNRIGEALFGALWRPIPEPWEDAYPSPEEPVVDFEI